MEDVRDSVVDDRRAAVKKATTFSLPSHIHNRLDALVSLAINAGESDGLTRSELLAALIFAASNDGNKLCELLVRYRRDEQTLPENVVPIGRGRK